MVLIFLICLFIFFALQNNAITVTSNTYTNSKLPQAFQGYTILQVSDLHNKNFGGRLVEEINGINPDIIVITGDLIDRRNTKIDIAVKFIEDINSIAPIYYVSGNHEQLSNDFGRLKKELEELNVNIIDNGYAVLSKGKDQVGILGIADPAILQREGNYLWADNSQYVKDSLEELLKEIDTDFNILLSHRPEEFKIYSTMNIDLVFCGHAHGGQVRIPFVGGLIAPHQGFFPKYTSGMYNDGRTSMVVSRGLGNSLFPLRVFNPPELVVVTLNKEKH